MAGTYKYILYTGNWNQCNTLNGRVNAKSESNAPNVGTLMLNHETNNTANKDKVMRNQGMTH